MTGGQVTVSGLSAAPRINGAEAALDRLTINALGGDDVIDASGLSADGIGLTINGGLGDDVMVGSEGDDLINGGDGDDTALMGGGDDTFVWNPGDDNDTIEGQAGTDTMLFNGANAAESIDIFANGGRALFTRDIANVVMDMNDIEAIEFNALGGADNIVVSDLSRHRHGNGAHRPRPGSTVPATVRPTRSRSAAPRATTSRWSLATAAWSRCSAWPRGW